MDEKKSLDFNLSIKTEPKSGEPLEISRFDTDFDVIKTNTPENNKASLVIWNLDDTSYQALAEKNDKVCIYVSFGDEDAALFFRGNINKLVRRADFKSADVPVILELTDGKEAYTTAYINKSYRDKVTSTVIIKDCISQMGLSTGTFSANLPERIYYGYKAKGLAHKVLQDICAALGVTFSVQNGLVHIVSENDEPVEETAFTLNLENSARPRRLGTEEMVIRTGFAPQIIPNNSVKCDFAEFSGLRTVKRVHSFGNNHGRAAITEIMI